MYRIPNAQTGIIQDFDKEEVEAWLHTHSISFATISLEKNLFGKKMVSPPDWQAYLGLDGDLRSTDPS